MATSLAFTVMPVPAPISRVIVSVAEAVDVSPAPPATVSVLESVIV